MNLEWLDDFLVLASERNFTRAAERRNVTQPAFSRRINALEAWIGAPLFDRTPQGAALTAAGDSLLGYAGNAVRGLHEARAAALEASGRAQATLALAATHALSFTFFPNWIRQHAPHETVNLISDSMAACEQMMLRGDATFLLHHSHEALDTTLKARQFRSVKVGEDMLVPVCCPDPDGRPLWPLRADGEGPPLPFLAYAEASGLGRILQAEWTRTGKSFRLDTIVTSRLAAALLTMARNGDGVAWLPRSLARPELDRGELVDAGGGAHSIPVDIALTRPRARLGLAAERFWANFV